MSIPNALPSILFVDDDPNLLQAVGRVLRRRFAITDAGSAEQALEILRGGARFAVIVSDYLMPGRNGVELLREARTIDSDAVRILLTGQADLSAAIQAVNEGSVFRFLEKPCPPDILISALDAARGQHDLVVGERVLLERTLSGSIAALVDVLAISQPSAYGKAGRVKRLVDEMTKDVEVPERWAVDIAAMVSQIGTISLAPALLDKLALGEELAADEATQVSQVPQVAARVIAHIPRLEAVRAILEGIGRPISSAQAKIATPLGARLLTIAFDFDDFVSRNVEPQEAIRRLQGRAGQYDLALLEKLATLYSGGVAQDSIREVRLADVVPGMIFATDVRTTDGKLLISRGQEATSGLVTRIQNYWVDLAIAGGVFVSFPGAVAKSA